jgi:phosphate transport system substrate-binding protein
VVAKTGELFRRQRPRALARPSRQDHRSDASDIRQKETIEVISTKWLLAAGALAALALGMAACGGDDDNGNGEGGELGGTIRIDGSSTVAPLSEAIAEEFQRENPDVRVTVGTSGTGGGFEKFCAGETDISDASRPIDEDEVRACEQGGVDHEELQVANDALSVVVNPENPVSCMTVDQLSQVWGPNADIANWSDVDGLRPSFDAELAIYSPGTDSGTFDYFTEAINGEEGAQRTADVNDIGEDDNATVTGVAGAEGGIGYLGFSFFQENEDQLKALEIDGGDGCVAPSVESVQDGSYAPLARPLLIYPSAQALQRPEVDAFLEFYLDNANNVAELVGFIGLTDEQLDESRQELERLIGGGGGGQSG